jgi:hypothetical protein
MMSQPLLRKDMSIFILGVVQALQNSPRIDYRLTNGRRAACALCCGRTYRAIRIHINRNLHCMLRTLVQTSIIWSERLEASALIEQFATHASAQALRRPATITC